MNADTLNSTICPKCQGPKRRGLKQCGPCRHKPRPLIDNGDGTFTVPLTKGYVAIIDVCDVEKVNKHLWSVSLSKSGRGSSYAIRRENKKTIYLHRQIFGFPKSRIDHIDLDGLNCRRFNLRPCTHQENTMNRPAQRNNRASIYKGVRPAHSIVKRFTARIQGEHIGTFDTEGEAARAYDREAINRFGEFAYLNFPEDHD